MQLEIYSLIALKDQISVSLEAICDSYSSLLWDIEFYQCGCFEVYIAASPQNVSIFQRGRIVARSDDAQHFGIIESLQLETDAEKGDYLTVRNNKTGEQFEIKPDELQENLLKEIAEKAI